MASLSQWGKPPKVDPVIVDPSVDMHTSPVEQVKKMIPTSPTPPNC
jgi:hypothetical protein